MDEKPKKRSRLRRTLLWVWWVFFGLVAVPLLTEYGIACYVEAQPSLAERLHFPKDAILLIVNADDSGLCPDSSSAAIDALQHGLITSTTVMVPPPGFDDFVTRAAGLNLDVGIHLVHTNEWKSWNWTPLLPREAVPGLYDARGFMPKDVLQVFYHASTREVYQEAVAQIERARSRHLNFNHIDSHMGAMQYFPNFFLAYLEVARKYDVPLRMPSRRFLNQYGMGFLRDIAYFHGLECPDELVMPHYSGYPDVKAYYLDFIRKLKPGVTEVYIHPALVSDTMKRITGSWNTRNQEYRVFLDDPEIRANLKARQVILIGYRHLFALQRGLPIPPPIEY